MSLRCPGRGTRRVVCGVLAAALYLLHFWAQLHDAVGHPIPDSMISAASPIDFGCRIMAFVMVYLVFFFPNANHPTWGRTRLAGPVGLGRHRYWLAWSWAVFSFLWSLTVVATLLQVTSAGIALPLERMVGRLVSLVTAAGLAGFVATRFFRSPPWPVRLGRFAGFWHFWMGGPFGAAVACYTWWALLNERRKRKPSAGPDGESGKADSSSPNADGAATDWKAAGGGRHADVKSEYRRYPWLSPLITGFSNKPNLNPKNPGGKINDRVSERLDGGSFHQVCAIKEIHRNTPRASVWHCRPTA